MILAKIFSIAFFVLYLREKIVCDNFITIVDKGKRLGTVNWLRIKSILVLRFIMSFIIDALLFVHRDLDEGKEGETPSYILFN